MTSPPGYYTAMGDPPGTVRYWDGTKWTSEPMQPPPGWGAAAAVADERFARFWIRAGASILDGIIGLIIAAPILIPWFVDAFEDFDLDQTDGQTAIVFDSGINTSLIVVGLLAGAVQLVMIALAGGTIGKLIVGLRITTEDGATTPPGFEKAARRMIPAVLGAVPVIGSLVGITALVLSIVWVNTDPERRSVYDRIAGTRVVYKSHL